MAETVDAYNRLKSILGGSVLTHTHMGIGQLATSPGTPVVHIKIAGNWMFIKPYDECFMADGLNSWQM